MVILSIRSGPAQNRGYVHGPLWSHSVWASAMTRELTRRLATSQRVMAIRMIRGYRSVSGESASLHAGLPPWDLEAEAVTSFCEAVMLAKEKAERER